MKPVLIMTACLTGLMLAGCAKTEQAITPSFDDIEAAQVAAGQLGKTLKGELMAALASQGVEGGVIVCSERAPEISAAVSAQTGMTVGRVSVKTRNPANMPDEWEQAGLELFQNALASGAQSNVMEHMEVVRQDGQNVFRWMKPILLGEPCQACHGTDISDEVKTVLAERYPGDMATGYEVGDLRGAYSVEKVLE